MEVEGADCSIGESLGCVGCGFREGRVRAPGAVPLVDLGCDVGEDKFGVGGGTASVGGDLSMLEDAVDWVKCTFEEGGETA